MPRGNSGKNKKRLIEENKSLKKLVEVLSRALGEVVGNIDELVSIWKEEEWVKGPPPKEEGRYWLVEFADGDRFEVVKYVKEDGRFEDQETFGYVSDPMIKHLEIPNPGDR